MTSAVLTFKGPFIAARARWPADKQRSSSRAKIFNPAFREISGPPPHLQPGEPNLNRLGYTPACGMELFPGQQEQITFSLEQLECLSSPFRVEVFWTFRPDEPRSAADVAAEIGKSAQAVHYHVAELVRVGLIVPAGTRQRRARTETLYVRAGRRAFSRTGDVPIEYRKELITSFAATTRMLVREVESFHEAAQTDPEIHELSTFRHRFLRMSPEGAERFRDKLRALIEECGEYGDPEGSERMHAVVFLYPTVATSRARRKKKR